MMRMKKSKHRRYAKEISDRFIIFLRRISIYKRLAYSYSLIVIVSTLILGISVLAISTSIVNANISRSTQLVLRNLTENLDSKMQTYESLVNQLSYNTKLRDLLMGCKELHASIPNPENSGEYRKLRMEIGNILYTTAFYRNDILNLEILTDYDEFVERDILGSAHGASLIDPLEYRESEIYQSAVKSQNKLMWFDTSKKTNEFKLTPTINMGYYITLVKSIPISYSSDTFGVIIMNIPISIFENTIDLEELYDKKEVVFLTGNYGMIRVLNGSYQIHNMPDQKTLWKIASMKKGTLNFHNRKTGGDSMLFFTDCGRSNLSVVYMVKKEALYSSIYLIIKMMIAVIIFCTVFSLMLSYLVTKSISQPLKSLQNIIASTGDGNLQAVYVDEQKDEISFLGSQFNEMMQRIQKLLYKIQEEERAHKNEQIKRKEAERVALQMNINPHFIYNTLDLIRWNAIFEEQGNGKVSQMLAAFSRLLRFNTKYVDMLVDIEEELAHVRSYIEVINFKDDFHVTLEIDTPDDSVLRNRLPKVTLQPLVENAVKHGVRDSNTEMLIRIKIRREDGMLRIVIYDNGCGIDSRHMNEINERLQSRNTPEEHIGLWNVNERIRLYFGENYGLQVESTENKYTSITICIPET